VTDPRCAGWAVTTGGWVASRVDCIGTWNKRGRSHCLTRFRASPFGARFASVCHPHLSRATSAVCGAGRSGLGGTTPSPGYRLAADTSIGDAGLDAREVRSDLAPADATRGAVPPRARRAARGAEAIAQRCRRWPRADAVRAWRGRGRQDRAAGRLRGRGARGRPGRVLGTCGGVRARLAVRGGPASAGGAAPRDRGSRACAVGGRRDRRIAAGDAHRRGGAAGRCLRRDARPLLGVRERKHATAAARGDR
jgi:hypothetical protein